MPHSALEIQDPPEGNRPQIEKLNLHMEDVK